MIISLEMSINGFNNLTSCNVDTTLFFMQFPPLPYFNIQVQHPHSKFHNVIGNAMEVKIMFHILDQNTRDRTIKLVHIYFRKVFPYIVTNEEQFMYVRNWKGMFMVKIFHLWRFLTRYLFIWPIQLVINWEEVSF